MFMKGLACFPNLALFACFLWSIPTQVPVSRPGVQVDETAVRLSLLDDRGEVSLPLSNDTKRDIPATIELEILDPLDRVVSSGVRTVTLGSGANLVSLFVEPSLVTMRPLNHLRLPLYRLRYRVRALERNTGPRYLAQGIVSVSEITEDLFELGVAAPGVARPGGSYRVNVRAVRAVSFRAAEGVQVHGELRFEERTEPVTDSSMTGRDGYAVLHLELPGELSNASVPEGSLVVTGQKGGIWCEVRQQVFLDRAARIFVITDKDLYQPGQTVHARLLAFDHRRQAIGDAEASIRITDPEERTLFSTSVSTSRFGVASADWRIPDNVRLGDYRIELALDEDRWGEESRETKWVRISRYELPTFSVSVEPDRSFYLPGQDAQVEVRADYLFGKPVQKGHVRVVREVEHHWNFRMQEWETEEGASYEGEIDSTRGAFTTHIDLDEAHEELAREPYRRSRDLDFAANVTDASTGRTEERRFRIRVSREPIHVYFIQKRYDLPRHQPFDFYVSTFSADGAPLSSLVTVRYVSSPDAREGVAAAPASGPVLAELRTNPYGVAEVSHILLSPEEDQEPALSLVTRDDQGREGHWVEHLWLTDTHPIEVDAGRTLHRPGDPIEVQIQGPGSLDTVVVNLTRNWDVLRSEVLRLSDGAGSVTFPYDPSFQGALSVSAHPMTEDGDWWDTVGWHPVLYPLQDELLIEARPSRLTYQPGDEATVDFHVDRPDGGSAESVLGVVVVDKAVGERVRTNQEFGDILFFDRFFENDELGSIRASDLLHLDLSRPAPDGLDLVAEILFRHRGYYPELESTRHYSSPKWVFEDRIFFEQEPLRRAMKERYGKGRFPETVAEVHDVLSKAGIDFDNLRDPWGNPFRLRLGPRNDKMVLELVSTGPDEQHGSPDDFAGMELSWHYFETAGKAIDRAAAAYHERTGRFIRDETTLREELLREGVGLETIRDPWGHPYRLELGVDDHDFTIVVWSAGPDGRHAAPWRYLTDDVRVWRSSIDYFETPRARVRSALDAYFAEAGVWPSNESQFREALRRSGIDWDQLRDPWGHSYYVTFETTSSYSDSIDIQAFPTGAEHSERRTTITPVTVKAGLVHVRSSGPDGEEGTGDDFEVADFRRALVEESSRRTFQPADTTEAGSTGAIHGTVRDETGRELPGTTVVAVKRDDALTRTTVSGELGRYLIDDLPPGLYDVRFELGGFRRLVVEEVPVKDRDATELDATLAVASLEETITVSAETPAFAPTSVAPPRFVAPSAGAIATPRLREQFPETLLWQPSLETGVTGEARLRFRLADNITTWKLSALASTVDGRIGTVEQEIRAFQPFFLEHDPPPVLTAGDSLALPVVLRNYTSSPLLVDVELQPESWFQTSGPGKRTLTVPTDESARVVFDLRFPDPVQDGKQRVTALSADAGDAVQKSITVKPDGEEIVRTTTRVLRDSARLEVEFPTDALENTREAELRIYPHLTDHVLESLEGILQRPYGCAEQLISTGYPSLMLLRFHHVHGGVSPGIVAKARSYVEQAYRRLLGYLEESGGFSYWGRGDADAAVTAYALRFLRDAREVIEVDEQILAGAEAWLKIRQLEDGRWPVYRWDEREDRARSAALTALVARTLTQREGPHVDRALDHLTGRVWELDEPYFIASCGLAALAHGRKSAVVQALDRLRVLAHEEAGTAYWRLETNTPFHGWGLPGRLEATALVVTLLARAGSAGLGSDEDLLSRGLLFLLRQKDRYGVWYSGQATVDVVEALLAVWEHRRPTTMTPESLPFEIQVNGRRVRSLLPGDEEGPLHYNLSPWMTGGVNAIEVGGEWGPDAVVEVVSRYYQPWSSDTGSETGSPLRLSVRYDRTEATVGDIVTCQVEAERVGYRGYGMMLAEIGFPPGAEVDRNSLESLLRELDDGLTGYDVLPDRLIAYLWPRAGGSSFSFQFRLRVGLAAKTAPSLLYDYYNPEARITVAPTRFLVR